MKPLFLYITILVSSALLFLLSDRGATSLNDSKAEISKRAKYPKTTTSSQPPRPKFSSNTNRQPGDPKQFDLARFESNYESLSSKYSGSELVQKQLELIDEIRGILHPDDVVDFLFLIYSSSGNLVSDNALETCTVILGSEGLEQAVHLVRKLDVSDPFSRRIITKAGACFMFAKPWELDKLLEAVPAATSRELRSGYCEQVIKSSHIGEKELLNFASWVEAGKMDSKTLSNSLGALNPTSDFRGIMGAAESGALSNFADANPDFAKNCFNAWSSGNPAEAAAFLAMSSSEEYSEQWAPALVSNWVQTSPREASRWVSAQSGVLFDSSAAALARTLASSSPQESVPWAMAIRDPAKRIPVFKRLAKDLRDTDATSARDEFWKGISPADYEALIRAGAEPPHGFR